MSTPRSDKSKKNWMSYLRPFLIILLALGLGKLIIMIKPEPDKKSFERRAPIVDVFTTQSEAITLKVRSQGTLMPRNETTLISQVSGVITDISPNFYPGKLFEKDEVLIKVDPLEYKATLAQAEANLAGAELALQQIEAEARQAREDWDAMGSGDVSELVLKRPQLIQAKANVKAAQAQVEWARDNLSKTSIRAPYKGYVKEKRVNTGQMLTARVSVLGDIFAVESAEVRLPIKGNDLAHLNDTSALEGSVVQLSAERAGKTIQRQAHIVRSENRMDPKTRQLFLVAKLDDPYNLAAKPDIPKIFMGQFVEALIDGRNYPEAIRIPRAALNERNEVYIIDSQSTLHIRKVVPLQKDLHFAIIGSGLQEGEQVCLTPLEFVIEGMNVDIESSSR